MVITFKPNNVCSQEMTLEVENGVVVHANVVRGCQGNLQGICRLIEGMKVEDVISAFAAYLQHLLYLSADAACDVSH